MEDNIAAQILDPYAPLHREPDSLVRKELREVERYYGILLAVATGDATPARISARTGLDVRQLSYYVQQLHDLRYLDRRQPLLPAGVRRRTVRYAIGDPLLRFWFHFLSPGRVVDPQRDLRRLDQPGRAREESVKK